MISKYNGNCFICGMATRAGKDLYDLDRKASYHSACEEAQENQPPGADQLALASKLGYRTAAEWDLLLLPPSANGDAAWWNRREASGYGSVSDVRTSDTIESITEVRGRQEY